MKQLYLASSIDITAKSIAQDIGVDTTKLKVAFINTAAEVKKGDLSWLTSDRNGLRNAGFNLFDYTITGKSSSDIERDLKNADIVHVNGGNVFYLLLQSRKSGFDKWLKQVVTHGKIYIGSSAGSIIASPNIEITKKLDTEIYEKELKTFEGFNLVDVITLPHWGNELFQEMYLNQRLDIAYKPENKIILLNDWQYIAVKDDSFEFKEVDHTT